MKTPTKKNLPLAVVTKDGGNAAERVLHAPVARRFTDSHDIISFYQRGLHCVIILIYFECVVYNFTCVCPLEEGNSTLIVANCMHYGRSKITSPLNNNLGALSTSNPL